MAGHLGAKNRTVQNLKIVRIDAERQLLLVQGAVPGSAGGHIVVKPAAKTPKSTAPAKK
jgi:large subunit ribosomal protein L3